MTELESFRAGKDRFFATHPESPLTSEQKWGFEGLHYFPENPALRREVVVEEFPQKEAIQMQTTTGGIQTYTRFGKFKFTVGGQEAELTLYAGPHGYFLPFADSLAGTEPYSAGCDLDPEPVGSGQFLVDFNLAYNPYCAYNENFSCPIPPRENRLKVQIRAGEKSFRE